MSISLSYLCLAISVFFTAFAQIFYKKYFLSKKKYCLFYSLLLSAFVPFTTYLALINLKLSFVYSFTSFIYVIVVICAKYFLNESISKTIFLASMIIIMGVIIFNY